MDIRGGYKAVDEAAEERIPGGRRGGSDWQNDEMAAEGGDELLPTARRKGHWEVVERDNWTKRRMQNARGVGKKRKRQIISSSSVRILKR